MLISLLVGVLILSIVYYVIVNMVPQPIQKVALLILAVIIIVWLLGFLGIWGAGPFWGGGYGPHTRLP